MSFQAAMLGLAIASLAAAADPSKPHPHTGMLEKYSRLPPSQIGVKVDVSAEALRKGTPVLKLMETPGGWMRSVSVQDVHAPESVVWSAINDVSAASTACVTPSTSKTICNALINGSTFSCVCVRACACVCTCASARDVHAAPSQLPRYPKMVEGVVACDVYSRKKEGGNDVTCATYKLKAAGFSMQYYMKHIFEPKKHSMTFHLDYERCSDIQDSVGYWYVEDLKDGWCRVYYSTDSKLPKFIPNCAKDAIVNMAAKRSTSWVDTRCNEITGNAPSEAGAGTSSSKRRPTRLGAAILALAAAWRSGALPAMPPLGELPATLSLIHI